MSLSLQDPAGLLGLDSAVAAPVSRLLDRLRAAIGELGYEAVIEDLSSPELIGGDDSLLGSDDVMVVPGHQADEARPILLAVTTGWGGKGPQTFSKIMCEVKARLIEARGAIHAAIVFSDCWDSASFREEPGAAQRSRPERCAIRVLYGRSA